MSTSPAFEFMEKFRWRGWVEAPLLTCIKRKDAEAAEGRKENTTSIWFLREPFWTLRLCVEKAACGVLFVQFEPATKKARSQNRASSGLKPKA